MMFYTHSGTQRYLLTILKMLTNPNGLQAAEHHKNENGKNSKGQDCWVEAEGCVCECVRVRVGGWGEASGHLEI